MAQWEIALVKEQGMNFAVASVQDHVISNRHEADDLISGLSFHLGQPVVLLGARQHRLYGRQDIVRFLQNVHPSQLPWRRVNIAA
jgi:hypothetical protein